jgi:hypothetical protein
MVLSIYIYILLVFFLLILVAMLTVLNNTKILATKMKTNIGNMVKTNEDFSIVLIGNENVIHIKGTTYTDLGYYAQTTGGVSVTAVVTTNLNINANGTYTYTYEVTFDGKTKSVTRNITVITKTTSFGYTGGSQTYITPADGYYLVEAWGASGGKAVGANGYGGYSSGYTYLIKNTNLIINVGGQGTITGGGSLVVAYGGYNGGGNAINQPDCCGSRYWGSGGGATDVRLDTSVNSRILVAGGGGGGYNDGPNCSLGGYGGGLIGQGGLTNNSWAPGPGGTQINGGIPISQNGVTSSTGTFGNGGSYSAPAGGGGGGYYGGSGSGHVDASGGGSSFISGYAGVNAITSASSTAATYNTLHYSGKYFISGNMAAGSNNGNGRAKITYIGETKPTRINSSLNNVRYIKDCRNGDTSNNGNYWVEIQGIVNGTNVAISKPVTGTSTITNANYITDGDISTDKYATGAGGSLQCVTVDLQKSYDLDEVAVWHYWGDGRTSYSNVTYVSADNSTWTTVISNPYPDTSQGKRASAYYIEYNYTGAAQSFTVPTNGYYNIELWGARGNSWNGVNNGGNGSYTSGKIYLNASTNIYIYVGAINSSFNGGAVGGNIGATEMGGGSTDIRLVGGAWNDATGLKSRIMVAAGGGGTGEASGAGGPGGGISGYNGIPAYSGYAATQTYGGGGYPNGSMSGSAGGFGYGGNGGLESCCAYGGAGGSGYYGGGGGAGIAGTDGAGAGGSSYISGHTGCVAITSSSSTSPRTGTSGAACSEGGTDNLCSIHYSGKYFTNTVMIDGAGYGWTNTKGSLTLMPDPSGGYYSSGYGNGRNGFARITYLEP